MEAANWHIMPAKLHHPEPSAAFLAREKATEILLNLDQFAGKHPIAGRLVQTMLLRQISADLAPVLLELIADVTGVPDLPCGRRRGDGRPQA